MTAALPLPALDNESFLTHLVVLIASYERDGPRTDPPPRYIGPFDWRTEFIESGLAAMAKRMYEAEERVARIATPSVQSEPSIGDSSGSTATIPDASITAPSARSAAPPSTAATHNQPPVGMGSSASSATSLLPTQSELFQTALQNGTEAIKDIKLLKAEMADVARVCNAVAAGDLDQKFSVSSENQSPMGEVKDAVRNMVDKISRFTNQVKQANISAGIEEKLGAQVSDAEVEGTWKEIAQSLNRLTSAYTLQTRSVNAVLKAIACGDFSKQAEYPASGEALDHKNTANALTVRLRAVVNEIKRVTLTVGSQGQLGGQVNLPDVDGLWRDLVENVNILCSSLTSSVHSISEVANAVSRGDYTQKVELQGEGEILAMKESINAMVDRLHDVVDTNS